MYDACKVLFSVFCSQFVLVRDLRKNDGNEFALQMLGLLFWCCQKGIWPLVDAKYLVNGQTACPENHKGFSEGGGGVFQARFCPPL